jgi:hypothetical protein
MEEGYTIEDAEKAAKENPVTFRIPSRLDRDSLEVKDFAKCIFLDKEGRGERMWVQIFEISTCPCGNCQNKLYIGGCSNQPTQIERPKLGDLVAFEPKNVIQIMKDKDAIVLSRGTQLMHESTNNPDWS